MRRATSEEQADHDHDLHKHEPRGSDPSLARRLMDVEACRRFILGGRATVTLRSVATQARFTYKVKAKGLVWFVSLMNGSDNESGFVYLGHLTSGGWEFRHGGAKAHMMADSVAVRAWAWAWAQLSRGVLPDALEVWHEGRCCRCGRKLTVPESIESGIGPECAGRMK